MKNILVTGGAGFIGSGFAKRLLELGYDVVSVDNFDPFYDRKLKERNLAQLQEYKSFTHIEGDLKEREFVKEIFDNHKIDLVVHLAAKAGVRPSIADPLAYFQNNVNSTVNILEEMKDRGLKKMIFASSSSVYGNNKKVPFAETDSVDNPISPYAASKKSGELICSTYHELYDIDIFAFRFFTVYGPGQRPEMAIAKFTDKIINDEPITLFDGKGATSRDYTYIDDIVQGMVNAIDKIEGFEIFNLGESQVTQLIDLVRIIETRLEKKAKIIFGERQAGDVEKTYADISKARKVLGYNPQTKIEDGISKYCDWLLDK